MSMTEKTKIPNYRDLQIWHKAIELSKAVYMLTRAFPKEEQYGLSAQIRRATVSVPSNIAEGQARYGKKEFAHFLYIARGSLAEIDTQCVIAQQLGYINEHQYQSIFSKVDELQRMIYTLIDKLNGTKIPST